MGRRCPEWEGILLGSLQGGASFDRIELASPPDGDSRKLGVELCGHGSVRFVRMESILPPLRDIIGGQPTSYDLRDVNLEDLLGRRPITMGTTVVALTIAGNEVHVGHVGDSRAYLVRGRQCTQLTSDHSRVAEMLRMRLITPEQAATHPARAQLTRSLGATPSVRVDVNNSLLERHDSLILCSDGLWDLVSKSEIAALTVKRPAAEAAQTMLDLALERGAPDNVTVVVVTVTADLLAAPSAPERSWLPFFRRNRDSREIQVSEDRGQE